MLQFGPIRRLADIPDTTDPDAAKKFLEKRERGPSIVKAEVSNTKPSSRQKTKAKAKSKSE